MTRGAGIDQRAATRRRYAPRMAPALRREQILDAALAVIVERGYARVSIEAIARTAGVTRPVVYDHFAGLGSLLQQLIEREERESLDQLGYVLPEDPDSLRPAEVLAASVRRFLDAVASRPATWTLILLPLEGTPEIVRRHVASNRARMLTRMESVVRWGLDQRDGAEEVPPTLDVELAARAILSLAEDAGRLVLTDPERYSPDRHERFVSRVMAVLWP